MVRDSSRTNRRKNFRFKPDPLDVVYIGCYDENERFIPQQVGLIAEESYSGCGIVSVAEKPFEVGQHLVIAVGKQLPQWAEVRWCRQVENDLLRVGLMFLAATARK